MKVEEVPNDKLVDLYVQLRDRRAQRKKVFELQDAADKVKQESIEGALLIRFQHDGSESVRTAYGTAFKSLVNYASVADRDTFMGHVKEHDAFELLDVRCNKVGVKQYIDEHGTVPPGVNWRSELHIRVQRS